MEILSKPRERIQVDPLISGLRYDWAIALLSLWMIGGVYLDAWAHHKFPIETFFTPWHAVLYSGFLAVAVLLSVTFVRNLARGYAWREAMPAGYSLSLVGAGVFLAGGVGDMLWHMLFGIEVNLEALLSPTHLLLAVGASLIGLGPLRATLNRPGSRSPGLPALISLTLLLAVLAFFTAYAHPLIEATGGEHSGSDRALTIAGVLLQTGLFMGVVLFALQRWELPFGSLTLIFTLSTVMAVGIHENFEMLPVGILSGLAADFLQVQLKPSIGNPGAVRWFAFSVPVIFYTLYFATRAITGSLDWAVHLWAGSILLAGIAGLLLSYAYVPRLEDEK
ncbi:MAG TPA: hypothetical protein VF498_13190 [Anaerolineales bacterium]